MTIISVRPDQELELQLELEVTGPEGGAFVLFQHGTPGSVRQPRTLADAVHERGHRLVTWSRPGYGASTRRPGRSISDGVADTVAVLDHLGADTCVVAGWSGGGSHALACGAILGDRVRAVLSTAGLAPYAAEGLDWTAGMGDDSVDEFELALEGAEPLRSYLEAQLPDVRQVTAEEIVDSMESLLAPADRTAATDDYAEFLATTFRHAVSRSVDGWLDDDLACVAPWGFEPVELAVPTYLWHGTEDLMAPCSHGRWLAERIPGVTAHFEPGHGHISVWLAAMDRMLDELLAHA